MHVGIFYLNFLSSLRSGILLNGYPERRCSAGFLTFTFSKLNYFSGLVLRTCVLLQQLNLCQRAGFFPNEARSYQNNSDNQVYPRQQRSSRKIVFLGIG